MVDAALLASELGAKALHDPTEGGLLGGLHEMAAAAAVGIRIDRNAVLWFEPGLAVCEALGCDPWSTLASGTLLAAVSGKAESALAAFAEAGHPAAAIGIVEAGDGVYDADGVALPWTTRDEVARVLAPADPLSDWVVKIPGDGRRTRALVEFLVPSLRRHVCRPLRRVALLGWLASEHSDGAFFGWSALVFAVIAVVAIGFEAAGERVTAGLFAFVSLVMFSVWVGSFEDLIGILDAGDGPFEGFRWGLLLFDLVIITASLILLSRFRFPLLVLPAVFMSWFFVVDLVSGGGTGRRSCRSSSASS